MPNDFAGPPGILLDAGDEVGRERDLALPLASLDREETERIVVTGGIGDPDLDKDLDLFESPKREAAAASAACLMDGGDVGVAVEEEETVTDELGEAAGIDVDSGAVAVEVRRGDGSGA